MTQLRRFDHTGTARFVTFSTDRRVRVFENQMCCKIFLKTLHEVRQKHRLKLLAYVAMPDHVHLILIPSEGTILSTPMGELKSLTARKILPVVRESGMIIEKLWKPRSYDRNCRNVAEVREKIDYIHRNPIRAGLVDDALKYHWSSFRWYVNGEDIPIPVDGWEKL